MSLFEFIMVLTSILIGLGIAELLNGVVRTIRTDFKERYYVPQILWAVFLFLHLITLWWSRWDLRDTMQWNFFQLLLSLTAPVLIFILVSLLFAENVHARVHYFKHRVIFFTLLSLVLVVDILHETIVEGTPFLSLDILITASILGMVVWCRFSKRTRVHVVGSAASLILLVLFVVYNSYLLH
ncbi:MAG: hypothetical protein JSW54_00560 [Fidelibacterota bacterium]|nr:MAG: hypothetical protein JSW54_00560 [Candidatus Neomarinimicrobiota bacterium]